MKKYLILILLSFVFYGCSIEYSSEKLIEQANKNENFPWEKNFGIGYFVIDSIKAISFDIPKQRVRIFFEGKIENRTWGTEKICQKIHLSIYPYILANEFRIKDIQVDGINCLGSEKKETKIANFLVQSIKQGDIKLLELSDLESKLVKSTEITEEGIIIYWKIF